LTLIYVIHRLAVDTDLVSRLPPTVAAGWGSRLGARCGSAADGWPVQGDPVLTALGFKA
jgi:hypothetical protein